MQCFKYEWTYEIFEICSKYILKKDSKSTGGRWYTSISIAVQIQEMVGQDKSLQESDRIRQE